ncbi:hypothetical protein F503_02190 [Ophiostoma piceae UAMH 11346]|uniref:Uncharacterized protein n=1 Tax=Ophiostoma piceae (strain UAMH 11346) TaxID=1262450 RepID=S3C157_OPHP1|nr:hypothetical protein F503_02190 [Ophiostoma piceae UAMH 11346]
MPSTSNAAGSGAPRLPVTETQILPPQIPPQALRPSVAPTTAPTGSGAPSAAVGSATPATTAQSAGGPAVASSASPPGVLKTRVLPPAPPRATPIPAPAVPLVQETPVPAPQIPGFNTSPSSGAGALGSPPKETKVVPPVPPMSTAKAPRQASKTTPRTQKAELAGPQASGSSSQFAAKRESSTPEQKQQQRAWSPPRPPISPVLAPADMPPHLQPLATGSGTFYKPNFASGRPVFKYTDAAREAAASNVHAEAHDQAATTARTGDAAGNVADATAQLPPGPVPVDFSTNPDVLALSSTLSILQIQRKKALDDIRRLQLAKDAALANPEAFLRQLQNTPGSGLGGAAPLHSRKDSSNSNSPGRHTTAASSVADKDGDVDMVMDADASPRLDKNNSQSRRGSAASASSSSSSSDESAAANPDSGIFNVVDLNSLPKPQNVVRMPHINWNKYAVVGEGLEKLHAEQIRRPPVGQPASASVLRGSEGDDHGEVGGPRIAFGQVNFGGGGGAAQGPTAGSAALYTFGGGYDNAVAAADSTPLAPVYRGVSAPYDPLVDVLEADHVTAGHRSSAGSTPGESGSMSAYGASFSSAGTGTGRGRGASISSTSGAAQPFAFTGAPPAASAGNAPTAASTRRSKSSKSSQPARR